MPIAAEPPLMLEDQKTNTEQPATTSVAAKIEELENQVKLLKAQQAVAQYATTQQTDAATAEKSLIDAQNTLLKSQIDQMKAYLPSTTAGLPGTITDGSSVRGSVQAWIDLDTAFQKVADTLKEKYGTRVLILNPPNLDDYVNSKWTAQSMSLAAKSLPDRIENLKKLTPPKLLEEPSLTQTRGPSVAFAPAVIAALAGPAIESVIGFSKLFRADRTVSGAAVTPGADSIYNVAAGHLAAAGFRVVDTEHLPVPDAKAADYFADSEVNSTLKKVLDQLAIVDHYYALVATNAKALEASPSAPKTDAIFYDAAVARWKELSDKLHQAIDPLVNVPASATDSFVFKLMRGTWIDHLLKDNGRILYLKVEALGGNRVVKKHVWTEDREYESSSYVVTYRIVDKYGNIETSGMVAANSDYKPVKLP